MARHPAAGLHTAEHRAADPAWQARREGRRTGPHSAREAEHDARDRPGTAAFETGVQALTQYIDREAGMPGRAHIEQLPDGTAHRTGVWIANQKQRCERLHPGQLAALAELGIDWA